jgi:hypothetical protein
MGGATIKQGGSNARTVSAMGGARAVSAVEGELTVSATAGARAVSTIGGARAVSAMGGARTGESTHNTRPTRRSDPAPSPGRGSQGCVEKEERGESREEK